MEELIKWLEKQIEEPLDTCFKKLESQKQHFM